MEAPVAALSRSPFHDLIDRVLYARRRRPRRAFNGARMRHPTIRLLAEAEVQSSELSDRAWLQRVELRGTESIARVLEAAGFAHRPGSIEAMFVDDRCGMICSEQVGAATRVHPDRAVTHILRSASRCQASGIILATHDSSGAIARERRLRKLTMSLYRKGEAINIFLLDHFVLTARGWRRMAPFQGGQPR